MDTTHSQQGEGHNQVLRDKHEEVDFIIPWEEKCNEADTKVYPEDAFADNDSGTSLLSI